MSCQGFNHSTSNSSKSSIKLPVHTEFFVSVNGAISHFLLERQTLFQFVTNKSLSARYMKICPVYVRGNMQYEMTKKVLTSLGL